MATCKLFFDFILLIFRICNVNMNAWSHFLSLLVFTTVYQCFQAFSNGHVKVPQWWTVKIVRSLTLRDLSSARPFPTVQRSERLTVVRVLKRSQTVIKTAWNVNGIVRIGERLGTYESERSNTFTFELQNSKNHCKISS